MTLTREHGLAAFIAAALLAGGVWVAQHTEWVDVQVRDAPDGAARRDPNHRLKQILTRLGAKVSTPENLDRLPPADATLVLSSAHWNLFPERSTTLRRWVESGGDLVVPNFIGPRSSDLDWVPVEWLPRQRPAPPNVSKVAAPDDTDTDSDSEDDDDDEAEGGEPPGPPLPARRVEAARVERPGCPGVSEPASVAPAFGLQRDYASCMYRDNTLQTAAPLLWALDGPRGHVVVRVAFGRGTITVTSALVPWNNDTVLDLDNGLMAAAALRAQPGREIWIVATEARPPLLSFLYRTGAPALLLGALALGFALWRGALRFGPPVAAVPLARRSVAEQIRGTARFIAQHGGAALHAAQLRALAEAARPRIHGFDALILGERAQAIASPTGLDAHALARAMKPVLSPALSRHPAAALALIETARRRLLNMSPAPSSSSSPEPR